MVKLAGSICILAGAALIWWRRLAEQRRQRETLREMAGALRQMGEEIRMTRTPLSTLLESLAADCRGEAAALFRAAAQAACQGNLAEVWRRETERLPLLPEDKQTIREISLRGDEESVCKAILLAIFRLEKSAERWERTGPEERKRTTALCFSGAALLVILLL